MRLYLKRVGQNKILRAALTGNVIIAVLMAAAAIGESLFMGNMIDGLTKQNRITVAAVFFIGVVVLQYLLKLIRIHFVEKGFLKAVKEMQMQLTGKILTSGYQEVSGEGEGDLSTIVVEETQSFVNETNGLFCGGIPAVLQIIVSFVICLSISWKLTVAGFLMIPVMALAGMAVSRPMEGLTEKRNEKRAGLNDYAANQFQLLEIIQVFRLGSMVREKFHELTAALQELENRSTAREAASKIIELLMGAVPYTVFFIGGGFLVHAGEISVGLFYIFLAIFNYVYEGLPAVQTMIMGVQKLKGSTKRLEVIYRLPEEQFAVRAPREISGRNGEVLIRNLNFSYPDKEVFRNFSCTFQPNQLSMLQGKNGAGKSTLLKILATLYGTAQGEIYYGGRLLCGDTLDQIRGQIGYVPQKCVIIPGSIRDNITLGDGTFSESRLTEVCRRAGLSELISQLPGNLDYEILGGEINLSFGQIQRINIARALIRNPGYLFLDEITSGLDEITRYSVLETIRTISRECTAIMVSHEEEDVRFADRIIEVPTLSDGA